MKCSFKDFPESIVNRAKYGHDGLLIIGPPGAKKTSLLIAHMRWIIEEQVNSVTNPTHLQNDFIYINADRLQFDPRAKDLKGFVEQINRTRYVFIDDLAVRHVTDFVRDALAAIISTRYDEILPTYVTTTHNISDIDPIIGKQTVRKLTDMCAIILKIKKGH